jgi:hypothetical protein
MRNLRELELELALALMLLVKLLAMHLKVEETSI